MITVIDIAKPKFYKGQKVEFIGGLGTIRECHPNSGNWSYLVGMEMGFRTENG
ncbi:hypothetical protein [Nostoc sp. FACHB-133]|uniref:hypothetical protein n=1 Tax=Nostoc sp. FACHB-133 TaxID=2692835 RepID=UPI001F54F853|nr:hypothetical protein [Nostoc sp. FACHB-133]